MRFKKSLFITSLLLILCTSQGYAYEDMEQNRLHVHGAARLLLTTHVDSLEVVLETPAHNLFGFEHLPKNDSEHQTVHNVAEKLENTADLLDTGDAGCVLENVAMDSAQILAHELEKHEVSESESDFSAYEETGSTVETDVANEHNDVDITWIFTCSNPEELSGISIKLFEAFPQGFKHLIVEWDTEIGMGILELQQDDTLSFAP